MTTATDPSGLRCLLQQEAASAWGLHWMLRGMVPHPEERGYREDAGGGSIGGSRPPWNAQVANQVMEFHRLVRDLEMHMTDELRKVARYPGVMRQTVVVRSLRGGSDENTRLALKHVVELGFSPIGDLTVRHAIKEVTGWTGRARLTLDPSNGVKRVPREPGRPEPRCPWCGYQTLRWLPVRAIITCVNPVCSDATGNRPMGQLGFDDVTLEPYLNWRDEPPTAGPYQEEGSA